MTKPKACMAARLAAMTAFTTCLALQAQTALAGPQCPKKTEPVELRLVQPLSVPRPLTAAGHAVTVNFASGWRVGTADGPVATSTQLKIALEHLVSVDVSGACGGWSDGFTHYPCALVISELGWKPAGLQATMALSGTSWLSSVGAWAPGVPGELPTSASQGSPTLRAMRQELTLQIPADELARGVMDTQGTLLFRLRVVGSPLRPLRLEDGANELQLRAVYCDPYPRA